METKQAALRTLSKLLTGAASRQIVLDKMGHLQLLLVLETETDAVSLSYTLTSFLNLASDPATQQALLEIDALKKIMGLFDLQSRDARVNAVILMILRTLASFASFIDGVIVFVICTHSLSCSSDYA